MRTTAATTGVWIQDDYTEAVVAYLDLFGFSDYLEKSGAKVSDVRLWLDELDNETDELREAVLHVHQVKSVVVSDSLVRAAPVRRGAVPPLHDLLLDALRVQRRLTSTLWTKADQALHPPALPVRGGIAVGSIYWNERHIFGGALVQAVKLEQNAGWPRVVVDPQVRLESNDTTRYLSGVDDVFTCGTTGFPLLIEGSGVRFLNYLAPIETVYGEWGDMQLYNNFLQGDRKSVV